jgi:uncharacterized protein YoxC
MAARTVPGRLDEISQAIGELKGSMKSIESYVHDHRHEVQNTSAKIDALAMKIGADMASIEARLDNRLRALEALNSQATGIKKLGQWLLQTILTIITTIATLLSIGNWHR